VDTNDVCYSSGKRQAKNPEGYSTNGILRNQAFLDEIAQALGIFIFADLNPEVATGLVKSLNG
jgi:hypothetical protein